MAKVIELFVMLLVMVAVIATLRFKRRVDHDVDVELGER